MQSEYRVLIPSAGLGSRVKGVSKNLNKALLTIGDKPVISHIIEKFSEDIEFVIPLGYKGDTIKQFLTLAYPTRTFIFENVDPYEGKGSGLGLSILAVEKHLQCPFIFTSNDTIVDEPIPLPTENWMGCSQVEDASEYRVLYADKHNMITEIGPKGTVDCHNAYIGLAGIKDYEKFWEAMHDETDLAIKIGESHGLKYLIEDNIKVTNFTWYDTGNLQALKKTKERFPRNKNINVLEKEDEAIWFINDKVIKFHIDKDFIQNRLKRAKSFTKFIPKIIDSSENMFVTEMIGDGSCFSKKPNVGKFKYFMDWIPKMWGEKNLDIDPNFFNNQCRKFYVDKTYDRVDLFFSKFERIDTEELINGIQMPPLKNILDKVDWDNICDGVPVNFHGDLHFENILSNEGEQPFYLIDWRQDFAGNTTAGDVYYDLAKLKHGFIISHDIIAKNLFNISIKFNVVEFDFYRKNVLTEIEKYFDNWCINNGYDLKKVNIMTALIFLNIAALHHHPYCLLLYYLGKSYLYNELNEGKIK